jgi:two-component system, NarL family, response regulator DevR
VGHRARVRETDTVTVRVFLCDDHDVVRRGLRDLLETEDDLEVVGEADTAELAVKRIGALRPDVAILDVRLPDGDGVEVCRDVRSRHPEVACLMLTSFSDDEALFDAVMAGAAGYLLKQVRETDLVAAVRTVAAGGSLLDPTTIQSVLDRARKGSEDDQRLGVLTAQERKIFDLIGEGRTNRQIGDEVFLAEKTVKNYVSSILMKLGMERRTEAAALAARVDERSRRDR